MSFKPRHPYIYVDDILALVAEKENVLRLLTAIIKAIFTVCCQPTTKVSQFTFSPEKWEELVVGSVQSWNYSQI